MKNEEINIYITQEEYNELFNAKSKQIAIDFNLESITFFESFIEIFITNDDYFDSLKESLSKRKMLNLILTQDDAILSKNSYSPVAIVLALKYKEDLFDSELKREYRVLLNKIRLESYLGKHTNDKYSLNIENKEIELSYADILNPILNETCYSKFMNKSLKYLDLLKIEFVYLLKEFIKDKQLFTSYNLSDQQLSFYKSIIESYDTSVINKYLVREFEYSDEIQINDEIRNKISEKVPKKISILKKTIYIYLSMFQILRYDFELVDDKIIKKHKDLTRIKEINSKNNKVFSYEFSCILAKIFEEMGINFEYNDKYIIARIKKYIVKYKAINQEFNAQTISEFDILKGITVLTDDKTTKLDFANVIDSVYKRIYQDKVNVEILKMPFNKLLMYYRLNSSKNSLPFEKKYTIFKKLITKVVTESNAIGYIYEIRKLIFNDDELDSNISFATIVEDNNPVVIITVNFVNINLYNSNKYVYYNPPHKIEKFSLNELRLQFFNGRFKYIKNSKDNIIGLEKSNI